MNPLQEKLLKAIDSNIWIEGVEESKGLDKAITACHKICLESQIELLNEITKDIPNVTPSTYVRCVTKLKELQTELNNLK